MGLGFQKHERAKRQAKLLLGFAVFLLVLVIVPKNPLAITNNNATRWLGTTFTAGTVTALPGRRSIAPGRVSGCRLTPRCLAASGWKRRWRNTPVPLQWRAPCPRICGHCWTLKYENTVKPL